MVMKGRILLVVATGVGLVVTACFAAKNAPEAQKRKEAALQAKRESTGDDKAQLTLFESAKAQAGAYAPAMIAGAATIGSLIGTEVMTEKDIQRVVKDANRNLEDYKTMTDKLVGKDQSKVIEKAVEQKRLADKYDMPWEETEQFRIVFGGQSIQFESTRAKVMSAIYELNRRFHNRGIVTFNKFLEYLGRPPVPDGNTRGWEVYIGEHTYGYSWIDIGLKECEDEPWVTEIYFAVYPHFLDEDYVERELKEDSSKITSGDAFMLGEGD